MAIKAVLFDKDGTLFDFHRTWSDWAETFLTEQAGGDRAQARRLGAAVGFDIEARTFDQDSVLIAATPRDIAARLLPYLPGASPSALITRMNTLSATAPQAAAAPLVPLLEDLRARGLNLGVATNDMVAPARAHLEQAGVLHLFDHVLGCDSGHGAKPQPGMLRAFAALVGSDPAEVVMVGDSPHDLIAARTAGMTALGVLTGMASRRQLSALADAVLPSIARLPNWLDARLPAVSAA